VGIQNGRTHEFRHYGSPLGICRGALGIREGQMTSREVQVEHAKEAGKFMVLDIRPV